MADVIHSSIHVIRGQESSDTPQVFIQPSGKRSPRAGETLIAFYDLRNATPAILADLTHILSDAYWRAPGGMTTAMRLSIKLVNDKVMDLNRGVPAGQSITGSMSCAVTNDDNVVIAQAGPAVAYARAQSGAFERIDPEGIPLALGTSRTVDTVFTNFAWKTGDTFVLTGSGSCEQVSDELVKACMSKGDARMAAGYLNANVKHGKMIGVAFTVSNRDVLAARELSQAEEVLPQPALASETLLRRTAPPTATRSATDTLGSSPNRPVEIKPRMPPILASAGAAAATAMGSAAHSIQKGLGAFGSQLLPASTAETLSRERSRTTTFTLASIAILLPIVVSLFVVILYFQLSGEAEKQQARTQIQQQLQAVQASPTKDTLVKALDSINAFNTKYPADAVAFSDNQRQVRQQLDQMNKVVRVPAATILTFDGAAARRIAASSLGVYVLDLNANRAEYEVLNTQRSAATGRPVALTPASGAAITTRFADVTWATGSTGAWRMEGAVLFSQEALYEYSASTGQLTALTVPVDAANTPVQITAGELFYGTAYLLDTGIGQIWRFTVKDNKLVQGATYFRSPYSQVKNSLDMAIDGAVYLLQKDGTVLKFFNRLPVQFTLNPSSLPEPLKNPVAIAVNGVDQGSGYIFVADAVSGAIYQFTKNGDYVKQFRSSNDEFTDAQDISIDNTSDTLYVNTPTKIYSFSIR